MQATSPSLPNWDLTPIFPSLQSAEFDSEFRAALQGIDSLAALWNELGIRRTASATVNAGTVEAFEKAVGAYNALARRLELLGSYLNCIVTTDAANELAQARLSELETRIAQLAPLETRLVAWVGSLNGQGLTAASTIAKEHGFWVERAAVLQGYQMSEVEEELAAALRPMGLGGWANLHSNLSALLEVPVKIGDEERRLPMSAVRGLASDPDRGVRQAAFEAELTAWKAAALPLGGALNGIKGYQRVVRERRGYADDVAPALLANNTDATTLAAMQEACVASFPLFRRYMAAKAKAHGVDRLAWYDLIAPLDSEGGTWIWPEATAFVEENFGHYSPELAAFARRAFHENWVDAGPRVGKVGGAYCTGMRPGESRVLMNFDGSFTDVSTLAHELGHGYHNHCLRGRTPLQSEIPMTLAETASIFCETLIFEAAMARADATAQLALLDNALSRNLQVVVDIHSRFLFEKAVFEARGERELTETEFCDLMTQAQRATYGPDLEPLHPYMWAVKGHYYGPTFYNFPYTFGLLLGLGLYALYQADPEPFRARYDDFLSRCGMADAATLARDFGFDLQTPAFWQESLNVIAGQIEEFERLVG